MAALPAIPASPGMKWRVFQTKVAPLLVFVMISGVVISIWKSEVACRPPVGAPGQGGIASAGPGATASNPLLPGQQGALKPIWTTALVFTNEQWGRAAEGLSVDHRERLQKASFSHGTTKAVPGFSKLGGPGISK